MSRDICRACGCPLEHDELRVLGAHISKLACDSALQKCRESKRLMTSSAEKLADFCKGLTRLERQELSVALSDPDVFGIFVALLRSDRL